MVDHAAFQAQMLKVKELGKLVNRQRDPVQAKGARAAYRRAVEEMRDMAPTDSMRETAETVLRDDPKAQS